MYRSTRGSSYADSHAGRRSSRACRERQTTRSPRSARRRRCPGSAEAAGAAPPGDGVTSVALTSTVVNLMLKPFAERRRPSRDASGVPVTREVAMPHSTSWPSRHSASAFAFATAAGAASPWAAAPSPNLRRCRLLTRSYRRSLPARRDRGRGCGRRRSTSCRCGRTAIVPRGRQPRSRSRSCP